MIKKFKGIFYKIAKISVVAFLVSLAILVYYGLTTTGEEIELPLLLGIYFLISTVAFVICILIAMVLEFVENIRRDTVYPVWYGLTIVVFWLAIVAIEHFLYKADVDWLGSLWAVIGIVAMIRSISYILAKKE